MGLQGYAPHYGFGAKPSLEDGFFRHNYFCCSAVVDVDFLIVADCDVAFLGKFITAQEGLVGEGGDHVHRAGSLTGWCNFASMEPGFFWPSATVKTLVDGRPV